MLLTIVLTIVLFHIFPSSSQLGNFAVLSQTTSGPDGQTEHTTQIIIHHWDKLEFSLHRSRRWMVAADGSRPAQHGVPQDIQGSALVQQDRANQGCQY